MATVKKMETNVEAIDMDEEREGGGDGELWKDISCTFSSKPQLKFLYWFLCCWPKDHKAILLRWSGKTISFWLRLSLYQIPLPLPSIYLHSHENETYGFMFHIIFSPLWTMLAAGIFMVPLFSHSSPSSPWPFPLPPHEVHFQIPFFLCSTFPFLLLENKDKTGNILCVAD